MQPGPDRARRSTIEELLPARQSPPSALRALSRSVQSRLWQDASCPGADGASPQKAKASVLPGGPRGSADRVLRLLPDSSVISCKRFASPPIPSSKAGAECPLLGPFARSRQRCRLAAVAQLFRPTSACLLYTSDAADDLLCVDLGGRRII